MNLWNKIRTVQAFTEDPVNPLFHLKFFTYLISSFPFISFEHQDIL